MPFDAKNHKYPNLCLPKMVIGQTLGCSSYPPSSFKIMPAFWLNNHSIAFPNPDQAESDGLIALGGDLRPERLLHAYRSGIFPWFEENGVYAWFSPDPRCILLPSDLRVHKSMRSIFNQQKFRYTLDTCFEEVMRTCAHNVRRGQYGSWISPAYVEAYGRLHEMGTAHSVEVWEGDELVGGLYGLSIGKIFCGESMFARRPNASKAGFILLTRALEKAGFWLIDCQQETEHLQSLGARTLPRRDFLNLLQHNQMEQTLLGKWSFTEDHQLMIIR